MIPYVVEVWASKMKGISGNDILLDIMINRTPSTGHIRAYRDDDKEISIYGSGLRYGCIDAPKKGAFYILGQRHDAVLSDHLGRQSAGPGPVL